MIERPLASERALVRSLKLTLSAICESGGALNEDAYSELTNLIFLSRVALKDILSTTPDLQLQPEILRLAIECGDKQLSELCYNRQWQYIRETEGEDAAKEFSKEIAEHAIRLQGSEIFKPFRIDD